MMLEISKNTLIREMKEEIGVEIIIKRPLYFVENFFHFDNKDFHELSILYLMEIPPDSNWIFDNDTFVGKEEFLLEEEDIYHGAGLDLIFKWVNIDELENLRLYPHFLRKSLKNLKPYPEHIVNYDD